MRWLKSTSPLFALPVGCLSIRSQLTPKLLTVTAVSSRNSVCLLRLINVLDTFFFRNMGRLIPMFRDGLTC